MRQVPKSVARRNDVGALYHQDHRPARRACAMGHAFWNDKPLTRRKIDRATFEVDQETSFYDIKEFIEVFVLVPVVFTLNHAKANDRIVHAAERLIVPFVGTRIDKLLHIDDFQRLMQNVQVRLVRKTLDSFFGINTQNLTTETVESVVKNYSSPSK